MSRGKQPRRLMLIRVGTVKSVKKTIWVAAAVAAALAAGSAQAFDATNLTMRTRAMYIKPVNQNGAIAAIGVPGDTVDVQSQWAPDIDFEYAVSDSFGVALLLTIPQTHTVTATQTGLGNNIRLGTVTQLPPTLTAKYYLGTDTFRPYVGAGVNFTLFTRDNLSVPTVGALDVRKTSFGGALQAGFDYRLNERWSVSVDAKKVWMGTTLSLAGNRLATVTIDPWLWGAGVGYRFGQ